VRFSVNREGAQHVTIRFAGIHSIFITGSRKKTRFPGRLKNATVRCFLFHMEKQFWRQFSWGFFIVNTLCVFSLFEFFILGKPYITIFILIFCATLYFNRKLLFRKKAVHSVGSESANASNN